jgi:MFS family permease
MRYARGVVERQASSPSSQRSLVIALIVAGAFFMEQLDGTVISTALPQMARSFGDDPVRLSIGMTAYLLTLAVFIPISGWVADRYGSRSVFGGAIVVFTAASVLCGISNDIWEFVAARVLQGIGGAMMVPVGRLIVLRTTEKKDLLRSMTFITWPGLVAPVLGPPIGGFITTYLSWR